MKIVLAFCFLILGMDKFISQNTEIASHIYRENAKHIVSVNSKCYYLDLWPTRLIGLNSSSQTTFSVALPGYYYNKLHRIIKTKDDCLAAIGTGIGCETYNLLTNRNYIVKVDTNGVVKFQTLIQFFYYSNIDQIVDFAQHNDSSYYVASDSLIYHYSKSGVFISKINSGVKNISALTALSNGNLLLNGITNNIRKNIEITTTASVITQQSSLSTIKKFTQTNSGKIYALTTDSTVLRLDNNLNQVNTTATSIGTNYLFSDFCERNDSIFVTGHNKFSKTPVYLLTGVNFNILYQAPASNRKNAFPTGIAIDRSNRVNIISRGMPTIPTATWQPYPGPLSFTSRYQLAMNGVFPATYDIGVQSFSVISATSDHSYGLANLLVVVKNFTKDTIKSFYLNYNGFFTYLCNDVTLHKYYTTAILPHSSVVVQTGDFYFEAGAIQNICIFTTIPNGCTDSNVDNDAFCQPIKLTTGFDDNKLADDVTSLFPNPFNSNLTIDSEIEMTNLILYNAVGSPVKVITVNVKTFSFDNSDLPNGIYLLKIETNQGSQIKKVIKE